MFTWSVSLLYADDAHIIFKDGLLPTDLHQNTAVCDHLVRRALHHCWSYSVSFVYKIGKKKKKENNLTNNITTN